MSNADRIFLEGGRAQDQNGSGVRLELSFRSEKDLDDKLWHEPDYAIDDLRYLLKEHQGELTPTLSRLALKAIALPLFIREFYGDMTPPETEEHIRTLPRRGAALLDAYMARVGDESINQAMLKQAIDDASVLQLISRSLHANKTDDIVLLPVGPTENHVDRPTSFTVLRRKQLGRALLFASSVRLPSYIHTPELNPHRIQIRPVDLLQGEATRYDLADALVAEQQGVANLEDLDLIAAADVHITNTINRHFDRIQPHF